MSLRWDCFAVSRRGLFALDGFPAAVTMLGLLEGEEHVMDGSVRVMSWNVMGTGSASERDARLDALAEVVSASRCDVLLVQEAWPEALDAVSSSSGLRQVAMAGYLDGYRCCAILCRPDLLPSGDDAASCAYLELEGSQSGHGYLAVFASMVVGSERWGLVSAHMPWGGRSEAARVQAVVSVDRHAASLWPDMSCPVVMGADMNSVPSSASWRSLVGLDTASSSPSPGSGVFWVDCFDVVGVGDGMTAGPSVAPLALATASSFPSSLRPDLEPARRYDGIFSRGWCHGRRGGPLRCRVFASSVARSASDHLPLVADLLA